MNADDLSAVAAAGIVRAVQEWMPHLKAQDLHFIQQAVLDADPETLWHCRIYRYGDGNAVFFRDVREIADGVEDFTAEAEEHTLLAMVQRALQTLRLALVDTRAD